MLESLGLETIDKVIGQCEDIFKMLSIEGYEHIESIVTRTKILSDICNNEVISVWLWLELNGRHDHYSISKLNHPDDVIQAAIAIWERIHMVQDSKQQLKLIDDNCRLLLKRLKNETSNYVSNIYREAIQIREKNNDKIAELEKEIERYKKRTLKHRTQIIWEWINNHKLISALITLIMLIAAIFTIFGYNIKDIIEWFKP